MVSTYSFAQKTYRHSPVLQKGIYLSFNPHSVLEPEQGAVGLGAGYRINKRFEIWNEINYLYKGFFQDPDKFKNLQGFRNITSLKYYYNNKHGFFVGIEFRIKKYSFDDKDNFINEQINDTLFNYPYRPSHTLIGGAVFWGKRFKLTANGKFEMEGNIGVGIKQRIIYRQRLPEGYIQYVNPYFIPKDGPILPDRDVEQSLPYFPAIFRFIYHL